MHVVKYLESERGWGGEVWFVGCDSEEEAWDKITKCNSENDDSNGVPDYYIVAFYEGEMVELPKGYKL